MVCSVLDPFCPHAVGAKLWGEGGIMTIPFTFRATVPLSTSTTNATSFFFYPDFVNGYGTAVASSGVTTLPALSPWPVSSPASGTDGRLVTAGFVIRNISNAMTVEGSYQVVPMTRYTVADAFTGSPLILDPRSRIVNATKAGETAVVSFRRGFGALDFHPALDGTGVQPDYQPWLVYFPATSAVNKYEIELVVHTEFNTTISGQYFLAATNGANSSRMTAKLGDAANAASGKLAQVVESSSGRAADAFGKQVAKVAIRVAGGALGTYFGGPYGGMAGAGAGGFIADRAIEVD